MAGRTLLGLFNIPSGETFCAMLEKRYVSAWVSLKILGVQKNDGSELHFPINFAINWEANPSFSGKTISHSWIYIHIIYRERDIYIYMYAMIIPLSHCPHHKNNQNSHLQFQTDSAYQPGSHGTLHLSDWFVVGVGGHKLSRALEVAGQSPRIIFVGKM